MLIDILHNAIIIGNDENYADKKKTSFWASETDTMAFDIFHRFKGTKPTNPMEGEKLMMLKMRKLTEMAIVSFIRSSGKLIERLTNDTRVYFEWGPNKVPISGYSDLGIQGNNEEILVEVKTYYGGKQHSDIRIGKVKASYLKQLAIYMFHYKIKHGILLMVNQGTGEMFEFDLYQKSDNEYAFICPDNEIEFNLMDDFMRWEKIYVNNVLKDIEPTPEYFYKYDIENIDWAKISTSQIAKARNNKAVIGDWQVKFSEYKDLIITRQGQTKGYTDKEIKRIKELTDGYSTKSSKKVKFDPTIL